MVYLSLNREKFLRLTMGFGYFMYSHSLVPVIDQWGSGSDNLITEFYTTLDVNANNSQVLEFRLEGKQNQTQQQNRHNIEYWKQ